MHRSIQRILDKSHTPIVRINPVEDVCDVTIVERIEAWGDDCDGCDYRDGNECALLNGNSPDPVDFCPQLADWRKEQ